MKSSKEIIFAVTSESIPIIFRGNNISISKMDLSLIGIVNYKQIFLKDVKKFKWIGVNIFRAETEDKVYYVLTKTESKLNKYLATSQCIPKVGERYPCLRLIYNYGGCFEDEIMTSPVKKSKKIDENLYRVKTNHEYIVKIIN